MVDNPQCRERKYCDFEVVLQNHEVQKEVCKFCGRRVIYRVVNGRVDNRQYLEDHIRDYCQPYGRTRKVWEELYGHRKAEYLEVAKDFQKKKYVGSEKFWMDAKEDAREAIKRAKKSTLIFT